LIILRQFSNDDSTQLCRKCNGKHHTSLCSNSSKQNDTTGLPVNARSTKLLQTVTLIASGNRNTRKRLSVRLIFDLGSNDSYITQSLKDTLKLDTVGSQRLKISKFGRKSNGSRVYTNCSLNLKSRFGGGSLRLQRL